MHERSVQIFGPSIRPATSAGETPLSHERPSGLVRSITTLEAPSRRAAAPVGPVRSHTAVEGISNIDQSEPERQYENFVPATIIHWTSDETRRKEYNKIDRSNKGVRGLFKRMFPKIAAKSSEPRFYDESERSDAGSVRRFRIDLPHEEELKTSRKWY